MKLIHPASSAHRRRGAALLLSVLILIVLISIVFQISIGTTTDARVGRNDVGLTLMDEAISSASYDIFEMLVADGEAEADSGGGEDPGAAAAGAMAGGEGGEESQEPSDSRKDEWASPQRTEINRIQLRLHLEAENSKYNVLNMLLGEENEEEAEEAFMRVVRIIDDYREGTDDDIGLRDAEEMALAMKKHMLERNRSGWPKPELLTNDEEREGLSLPMSLRDFLVLEEFEEYQFRCYRDSRDNRVHSLDQYLTVWSSPGIASDITQGNDMGGSSTTTPAGSGSESSEGESGDGAEGQSDADNQDGGAAGSGGGDSGGDSGGGSTSAGYGVNINLAPAVVLKSLLDDRDVSSRFWDDVIEYRNLEEEDEGGNSYDEEPIYDEFGEQLIERQAFETLEELSEVRSWEDIDTELQERVQNLLVTRSQVFSIYITARRNTSANDDYGMATSARDQARQEEEPSGALVRTVRMIVWRRSTDDGVMIVPIVPWEVMSYSPFPIEDYPEDNY